MVLIKTKVYVSVSFYVRRRCVLRSSRLVLLMKGRLLVLLLCGGGRVRHLVGNPTASQFVVLDPPQVLPPPPSPLPPPLLPFPLPVVASSQALLIRRRHLYR